VKSHSQPVYRNKQKNIIFQVSIFAVLEEERGQKYLFVEMTDVFWPGILC
jgi:hypothetical protein